jgi:hypothetical protein
MGGRGSGRWYRWDSKDTIESCRRIDVRRLQRDGLLKSGNQFLWAWWSRDGAQTASIRIYVGNDQIDLIYKTRSRGEEERHDVKETVYLQWTPCHYGGQRPWFTCPGIINEVVCARRVAILYGSGRYFLCRAIAMTSGMSPREKRRIIACYGRVRRY